MTVSVMDEEDMGNMIDALRALHNIGIIDFPTMKMAIGWTADEYIRSDESGAAKLTMHRKINQY